MWYGLIMLGICGIVLIFLAQFRLWLAAAILTNRRPSLLFIMPAIFLSAAMLLGLSAFFRLGSLPASEPEEVSHLYVLLDCSVSMTAEAGQGVSRLALAKKGLRHLPSALDGWELALVTFAGEPLLDFPPSTDHRGWLDALEAVSPERPPLSGSSPGRGVQLVAETAALCTSGKAVVLLVSDGEVNVEELEQEEALWQQRDLPCLFVLTGAPGEQKAIPDPTGWLAARVPSGKALSIADDQEMLRLLGLSASPFEVITEQFEAGDAAVLSEKIQRLIGENLGQSGVDAKSGGNRPLFLLLLAAACALLSIFSSGYGLPKMNILLLVAVLGGMPLPAVADPALELCREAVQKTDHPDELRRAIGLYQQALRLQPGLELAARNLEYTLLQLDNAISSRQKKTAPDSALQSADQPEKAPVGGEAGGGSAVMTADEQAAQIRGTTGAKNGTWRELQSRRRKMIKPPPKCKPW